MNNEPTGMASTASRKITVARTAYLDKLSQMQNKRIIKVITGVRRCGKSTLLLQFQKRLRSQGISQEQIMSIHLDRLSSEPLLEYHALYSYILGRLCKRGTTYVFLDEIQLVPHFQKAVLSVFEEEDVDLYLTGSNASLLSGELATLLAGRYIELSMFPLSFKEYCTMRGANPLQAWQDFFKWGGFPYLTQVEPEEIRLDYLSGIYHTVLLKDVMERRNIQDATKLENVVKFMLDNIGNIYNKV